MQRSRNFYSVFMHIHTELAQEWESTRMEINFSTVSRNQLIEVVQPV